MDAEVQRRLVHASGTGVPGLYLLDIATWRQVAWLALGCAVVALVLEAIRLFVGLDWSIYDRLTREYEQDNLAGYALYMIGMAVVAWTFDPQVAVPAILMLTIGDPISGLLGSGELRDTKRSHVLVVMFAVCLVLAVPFVWLPAAILGAAAATFADGVKPVIAGYVIDDNITIPVLSAGAMFLALRLVPA